MLAGAVAWVSTNSWPGFISLGTSGVYFTVSESQKANPENTVMRFVNALAEPLHQMGVTLSAAKFNWLWFSSWWVKPFWITGRIRRFRPSYRKPSRPPARVLVFYRNLMWWTHTAQWPISEWHQFVGLVNTTNVEAMTLAVLEGVWRFLY